MITQPRFCNRLLSSGYRRNRSILGTIGAAICLALGMNSPARADIIVAAPTITLPYSATDRTETAEIYVQDTDTSSPQISADNVEVSLPNSPDVFFTAAGATVNHPYLFGQQSPMVLVDSDVVDATDFASSTVPVLADGDGLLLVQFTVKGGTTGDFPLSFATDYPADPMATALFDQAANPVAFSVVGGSIDIASAVMPVPEPASLLTALAAIVAAAALGWRRFAKSRRWISSAVI